MKIKEFAYNVTEEELNAEIARVQDRNARKVAVEDRAAQLGDIANIDFVGTVDGVKFDGGEAEGFDLTLGSGQFIPGFEDQVVGMNIGETKDVNVTFPENYQAEALKGKAAVFAVKLNALQAKELPELTDEFIKDATGSATVEEYKAKAMERLQKQADRRANDATENSILEAIAANTEVEIPSVMIDDKVEEFLSDINARLSQQGLALDQYLQYIGKTMDELKEEQRPSAEKSVKTEVTLLEVAKKENIEATDVDVDAEIAKVALMTNSKPEDIKARLMESGQFSVLVFSIMLKKAIDFLVENAEITEE